MRQEIARSFFASAVLILCAACGGGGGGSALDAGNVDGAGAATRW